MGTIRTAIALYDGVTSPLQSMHKAMGIVLNTFESMQQASGKAVDTAAIREAREEWAKAGTAFDEIERNIMDADQAQQKLNNDLKNGTVGAGSLLGKIKGIVTAYAGIQGIKKTISWVSENLAMSDTQRNAETQLKTVLANVGATEDAFDRLAAKASSIQGAGIYGDEIMLGGAAELATYISDVDALESMMGTLANYAAGMSGGGEIDYSAMVDYATQLGKALDGTYDGLKKKGFELSDAQKKIIENGTDMEKALVLDEVINQSWDSLYNTISETPEGKIIQLKNSWGDLQETLGNKLYPVVLKIVDAMQSRWPTIENVMGGIADAAGVLVTILGAVLSVAINVAGGIVDNWSILAPIIGGVAAALLLYNGYLIANNVITGISNTLKGIAAVQAYHAAAANTTLAASEQAEAMAKASATAAQYGFNAALLSCPLTWILLIIIAVIAAIYLAVAAINKFKGTTISATGIIAGAFAVLGAFLINTFIVPAQNHFATFANFIGNVFNNPIGAVEVAFYDMCLTVLGYISKLAHAIEDLLNKIPGVTVDITSGLDNFYAGIEDAQQKVKDESGWVEYVKKMDFIDYSDAASAGYEFGKGIEDKVSGMFDFSAMDSMGAFDMGNSLDDIYGNTGDIANNTAATADALDVTEEDLKYLRDIAEREAINRFTTAEVKVEQTNNNYISGDTDLDGIMDAWANDFAEKLDVSEEGVHE